jgi:hypothetical protein
LPNAPPLPMHRPARPQQRSRQSLFGRLLCPSAALALAACATSSVTLTGMARPPVSPEQVRIYTSRPANFEEVALLRVSRRGVGASGEQALEKVIDTMKADAAKLGANGLWLEDFSDSPSLALGTGIGSDTYAHNGSIGLGVGGDIAIVKRSGKGRAIYIAPPRL